MRTVADIRDGRASGVFVRPTSFCRVPNTAFFIVAYKEGVGVPVEGVALFNPPPCNKSFMDDATEQLERSGCVIVGDVIEMINGKPMIAGLFFNSVRDDLTKWTVPERALGKHCPVCPTDAPQTERAA